MGVLRVIDLYLSPLNFPKSSTAKGFDKRFDFVAKGWSIIATKMAGKLGMRNRSVVWLEKALSDWFDRFGDNPGKWSSNRTGRLIRTRMEALGNFKKKRSGNPKKGGYASIRKQMETYGKNRLLDKRCWKRNLENEVAEKKVEVIPAVYTGPENG